MMPMQASQIHRNSLGYSIGHAGEAMIVWGNDKFGNRVWIEEAERGGSQGLACECGANLVAKKGDELSHHFAHASGHSKSCEAATKAAAVRFISETLVKSKRLNLPEVGNQPHHTTILAVSESGYNQFPIHSIDAPNNEKLMLITRIKSKKIMGIAETARANKVSAMTIDLFRHRTLPDRELRERLTKTARRSWIYRHDIRDELSLREVRRQLFGF